MPKIEQTDSKIRVSLENGPEVFTANDPLEATNQLASALDEGKKWGKEGWAKAKQYEAELAAIKSTPPSNVSQSPVDQNEAQLQKYLLDQTARALGYNSADEYKADLMRVKGTTDKVNNQLVANEFLALNQDFPNTPQAIDSLSKKIDEMKWDFSPQSMTAAHALLVRENAQDSTKGYSPLTAEEVNSQWANSMSQANRQPPPPMLRSSAPDSRQQGPDPYAMKLDDLRNAAIQQELGRK